MTESDRRPVVSLAGVGKTFAVGATTTVALSGSTSRSGAASSCR